MTSRLSSFVLTWMSTNPASSRYCLRDASSGAPLTQQARASAVLSRSGMTFSGLTMWVGLWDLIEDHVLPNTFSACAHEPSLGCAAVKLTLVAVGGVGLYLTRSLYGDHGSGPVHFQRL